MAQGEKTIYSGQTMRAIPWMRDKGIVPTGHAPKTIPREPPNQDDLFE